MLIRSTVLPLFLGIFLLSCSTGMELANTSNPSIIENVRFSQENNVVTVKYDLNGNGRSNNQTYYIELLLENENGEVFQINSPAVSGDIGSQVRPGPDREIVWNVLQDFPNGLESGQVQFAVNAWEVAERNRRWIYITAGALVLSAGITAAILLLGGGNGSSGLPPPPSRPG